MMQNPREALCGGDKPAGERSGDSPTGGEVDGGQTERERERDLGG